MADLVRRNFRQYDYDLGYQGIMVPQGPPYAAPSVTVAPTASQAYYLRFVVSRPMTITKIQFRVATLGNDEEFSVGIYLASTRAQLVTSGVLTSASGAVTGGGLNTTGLKSVAITPTTCVPRTVYYAGFSMGATPGAVRVHSVNFVNSLSGSFFGTTMATGIQVGISGAAHPLPATASSSPGGTIDAPILILTES